MSWTLEGWNITRVEEPDFSLILPTDERTVEKLKQSPWLHPAFVTDAWELRVGSSAILLQDGLLQGGLPTILVDPWLAFDDPAAHPRRLGALAAAGVDPADVDIVVNSHIDGIGANVTPGTDEPAFPNARYFLPAAELQAARDGLHPNATAWTTLEPVIAFEGPMELAPGVRLEELPGHNHGHYGVAIGEAALTVGHLFLHPAQVANPEGDPKADPDPDLVYQTRLRVLERCAAHGTVLIGHLFAAPGGGRVGRDGDRFALEGVASLTA